MDCHYRVRWTVYISIASLFVFISLSEVGPFHSFLKKRIFLQFNELDSHRYVIMFDGGSTGTRMHVFTFSNNSSGFLNLVNEYFEEVKPGLSNFAQNPHMAVENVSPLLEKAKELIPVDFWSKTPIALKATAGLRLLQTYESDSIIKEVSRALDSSPFKCDDSSVSVLDGKDEGIFAWYTLNFLLGKLSNPLESGACLDLGGGSMQVTFSPVDFNTIATSPRNYISNTKVSNQTWALYTNSYLGLGLMAARLSILEHLDVLDPKPEGNATILITSCVPPSLETLWIFDRRHYIVRGSDKEEYGYESCYDKASHFLETIVDQPAELLIRDIYVLAYFFNRAVLLGIVGSNGGWSTVGEFEVACKRACSEKKLQKWFLCLDCSYISALFQNGFGFPKDKQINFVNKTNGIETSWSLGAALNLLD